MVILFFTNCKEEPVQPPLQEKISLSKNVTISPTDSFKISAVVTVDSTKTKDKTKDKDKGGGITPLAPVCGTLDLNHWELDHYEAASGKIVGIWPTEERWGNVDRIKQLKDAFGFNYIFINFGYSLTNCLSAGYSYENMLGGGLNVSGGYNDINSYPALWGYYSDEPISAQNGNTTQVAVFSSYFQNYFPNSRIIMGENIVSNASEIAPYVTDITCTRYNDYPFNQTDQRPLWQSFQNSFSGKFSMVWIGAHVDYGTYGELIGWAKYHGLNSIWLYQYQDGTDSYSTNNLDSFAFNAWMHGYLRKFERLWYYEYKCMKADPCDCNRNDITDGWELNRKVKSGALREVTY
ncbi:MAG: hypothetical protein HYZ10_12125 [Ignavibacteriales bacterium]|nr:hypothetical protein [Ignavibacteriales bacterium]